MKPIFDSNCAYDLYVGVGQLLKEIFPLSEVGIYTLNSEHDRLVPELVIEEDKLILLEPKESRYIKQEDSECILVKAVASNETQLRKDNSTEDMSIPMVYEGEMLAILYVKSIEEDFSLGSMKKALGEIALNCAIRLKQFDKIKKIELETGYLNAFIDENPASIAMLDKEGNYIKVSDRWQNHFIKHPTSLIGENHFTLFPIYAMRWKHLFKKALRGKT